MDALAKPTEPALLPLPKVLSWFVDYGERILLLLFYAMLFHNVFPSLGRQPINTLLLVSESIVIGFIIFRRKSVNVTMRAVDWAIALGGTICPLFLRSGGQPLGPPALAAALMILGILTHLGAKLSLRRSIGMAAANRGVMMGGLYRYIRHPMYMGYAITWVGFLLLNPTPTNFALIIFAAIMQVLRILAEERLLAGDLAYRAYMDRVRFRVLPGVF